MNPPRSIIVGPHPYRVSLDLRGLVGDHAEDRGSTFNETLSIALDGRLPASLLRETTLHEVLHAAWDQTPLKATGAADHEELVIDALAPMILEVLRRNPKLVAFLLGRP